MSSGDKDNFQKLYEAYINAFQEKKKQTSQKEVQVIWNDVKKGL